MHHADFSFKGDNFFIGHKLALKSWTSLVMAGLAGITAALCSIDPCFRIRCNLLFCV
jgi:hypothetical protein